MSSGLYSGVSGIALGSGLYRNVSGLWGGASGLTAGFGGAALSLDFLAMTAPTFDNRITFTRGSNATLTDSTGKVTYAPANLVTYSQEFGNAAWVKTSTTVTSDNAVAPDGTTTADTVTSNAVNSLIYQNYLFAAITYRFSLWLRRVSGTGVVQGTLNNFNYTNFTLTSEWQRFSFSWTPAAGNNNFQIRFGSNGDVVEMWGAQLEAVTYQTTPGTYVATTSSAYYGPRFDYDPVTLAPKGLLIEEARTNLVLRSAEFDNAAWAKINGLTATPNTTVAPDGTTTADTISTGGATNTYAIQTTAATTGAISFFAKENTARYFVIIHETYASGDYAVFDLQSGAITQQPTYAGSTAQIVNVGNGWFRCILNSAQSGPTVGFSISGASTGIPTPTTGTIYIWGAQLEAGAFATSYIPTVASTVTRSVDLATMTGTNFSGWYNQSAGTFVSSSVAVPASVGRVLGANGGTSSNAILVGNGYGQIYAGGVSQCYIGTTALTGTIAKQALAYATNDAAYSQNGSAIVSDITVTLPTVDRLAIGASVTGTGPFSGHIRSIAYYNTRLPNAQLQALTA